MRRREITSNCPDCPSTVGSGGGLRGAGGGVAGAGSAGYLYMHGLVYGGFIFFVLITETNKVQKYPTKSKYRKY